MWSLGYESVWLVPPGNGGRLWGRVNIIIIIMTVIIMVIIIIIDIVVIIL